MKKIFIIMLISFIVFGAVSTYADDDSKMTFDNVTFGTAYKIKGYASITLLGFKFVNMYAQWEDGKAGATQKGEGTWGSSHDKYRNCVFYQKPVDGKRGYYYEYSQFKKSGEESEFAWLKVDVTNLQKMPVNFIKDISIKVIYDDEYEYDGWVRQFNYDYSKSEIYGYKENTVIGYPVCLSPVDEMPISPMYKGHYAFGCTLPNFVVEDKSASLRMIIIMDDHKLTYNIR